MSYTSLTTFIKYKEDATGAVQVWDCKEKEWHTIDRDSKQSHAVLWKLFQVVLKLAYFIKHKCREEYLLEVFPRALVDQVPQLSEKILLQERLLHSRIFSQNLQHIISKWFPARPTKPVTEPELRKLAEDDHHAFRRFYAPLNEALDLAAITEESSLHCTLPLQHGINCLTWAVKYSLDHASPHDAKSRNMAWKNVSVNNGLHLLALPLRAQLGGGQRSRIVDHKASNAHLIRRPRQQMLLREDEPPELPSHAPVMKVKTARKKRKLDCEKTEAEKQRTIKRRKERYFSTGVQVFTFLVDAQKHCTVT